MRWGKGDAAALLRNQLTFGLLTRQEGNFEFNSGRPLFHDVLCLDSFVPRIFGVPIIGVIIAKRSAHEPAMNLY